MIVLRDISIDDYHASEFLSHSKLADFDDLGAAGYYARHVARASKRPSTPALIFGQAFEEAAQRPAEYLTKYAIRPSSVDGRTKDGKAWIAEQEAAGKIVLTGDEGETIERMVNAFSRNRTATDLVRGAQTQCTLRREFELDALPGIQSRPDWLLHHGSVDLKSTRAFSAFDREIANHGYHSQAALIDIVAGRAPRFLIVCENVFPYRCQVVELDASWLDVGRIWCEQQIDLLRWCVESNEWPACEEKRTSEIVPWLAREVA